MATLIDPDGNVTEVSPANGSTFSLEELQAFVGGYIQIIGVSNDRLCVMNEEGKLIGLPPNLPATAIVDSLWADDYLAGTVLFCDSKEIE
jgi:hypothetical protein